MNRLKWLAIVIACMLGAPPANAESPTTQPFTIDTTTPDLRAIIHEVLAHPAPDAAIHLVINCHERD